MWLLQLINCKLTTLTAIHQAGFVHCDVQEDDMVEIVSGFCLLG